MVYNTEKYSANETKTIKYVRHIRILNILRIVYTHYYYCHLEYIQPVEGDVFATSNKWAESINNRL